ncbi:MAG: glycosyltransferase family 4 protein [Usitatibacter sp.]
MKILHTESSLGWGGQEIRVLTEARGVARRGHTVAIAAPREARIFAEAPAYGVEIIGLSIARKGLAGVGAVKRLLAERPFDIVNTHSSTDSWLVTLAGAWARHVPAIVRTRHISSPVPRNFASRWLYARADRIVTTGERLRLQVIEETGADPARTVSIPTGIDLGRFRPGDRAAARAGLGLPADASIVGIVATLRSWKGHLHLLEAVASLARPGIRLVVVGDGPMREALVARTAELGLAGRVTFAGNQREVAPWMQSFDLFCLPSYANEGVPQALAQAMACGLAVVTTPVGSISELVDDGRTGLIVPPAQPALLAQAIAALLDDPARRISLGDAALAEARTRLGEDAMVDAMIRVFSEALACSSPPRSSAHSG